MLQTIKDNLALIAMVLFTFAVLTLSFLLSTANVKLGIAEVKIEKQIAANALLQTDLDNATAQLKAAEIEKERLRLDAALTAKTLAVREQGRDAVASELVNTQTKAKAVIEDATDDSVKAWAVASVPVELNRLLEHAAHCAHIDSDANGLCPATAGAHERMRDPGVHGPNQSATL